MLADFVKWPVSQIERNVRSAECFLVTQVLLSSYIMTYVNVLLSQLVTYSLKKSHKCVWLCLLY